MLFFFKQKTAYEMRISDWSSDVCSSDLLLLDRGETKGWLGSSEILIEAGIFAFTFYLFIVHQLTTPKPFLPLHLFVDRNFAAGLAMIGIVGVVLFATSALQIGRAHV